MVRLGTPELYHHAALSPGPSALTTGREWSTGKETLKALDGVPQSCGGYLDIWIIL